MIRRILRQVRNAFRRRPPEAPPIWSHGYDLQLTDDDIRDKKHRDLVGGMWDELGRLQFDFMRDRGLRPEHRFLDVGCGALRGGVHFIRYLEPGRYFGVDMNSTLLKAGQEELAAAGLADRAPTLLANERFEFRKFNVRFDFALALSVFTHIDLNSIQRCLVNLADVLEPGGRFYATYFPAPKLHHLEPLEHLDGIVTRSDADPFHYHASALQFLTTDLPLSARNIGAWGHPRGQHLLEIARHS